MGKCLDADTCKKYHLKKIADEYLAEAFYKLHPECENVKFEDLSVYCSKCKNFGHSAVMCAGLYREVQGIKCFKCGGIGHKANKCMAA